MVGIALIIALVNPWLQILCAIGDDDRIKWGYFGLIKGLFVVFGIFWMVLATPYIVMNQVFVLSESVLFFILHPSFEAIVFLLVPILAHFYYWLIMDNLHIILKDDRYKSWLSFN